MPESFYHPQAIDVRSGWISVQAVRERWELGDKWWTGKPVARAYCQFLLTNGAMVTVFREARSGAWFRHQG